MQSSINMLAKIHEGGNDDQQGVASIDIDIEGTANVPEENIGSFKTEYRKSIEPIMSLLEDLIGRFVSKSH